MIGGAPSSTSLPDLRTVTFYSYKGGTGRTLLLANLAMLAASLGRKVVAPRLRPRGPRGLPYKLFKGDRPRAEGLGGWRRPTPATYELGLVGSLNNLSIRLAEAGRRDEGLAAIEAAVEVYRRLGGGQPRGI